MAYRQKNPLNKNYSPLNNVMALARGVKKAVQDINDNTQIDPGFNPEYRNKYKVVDEQGRSGDDISGGYSGYTESGSPDGVYSPSGSQANLYRTGDVWINDTTKQRAMRFDPEKYLEYYQDERNNLNQAPTSEKPGIQYPWQEELYKRTGAPGSDERANYLRSRNEMYDR